MNAHFSYCTPGYCAYQDDHCPLAAIHAHYKQSVEAARKAEEKAINDTNIADRIIDKLISDMHDRYGFAQVLESLQDKTLDGMKAKWRGIIQGELENAADELVTLNLRKRLPRVLDKVKDLWIEELKDKDLFNV